MFCYRCMREKGNETSCPFCGSFNTFDPSDRFLPPGTVIGGRYILGAVLGEGGFGITYIGFDKVLELRVAVKEYFHYGFTHRDCTVSNAVTVSAGEKSEIFEKGKQRFLSEAKNVARFQDEPGIVNVSDFIEENNTAYIVMEYLDGIDLKAYLNQNGVLSVDETVSLLTPVIRSLDKMHAAGLIHRDISPDNLMYLKDGSVKLMDFGAAREYFGDDLSMSVMLKQGYAPEEQYRRNGKQGPWTDVYALCATFYRCITGKTPVDSIDRLYEDPLQKPSSLGICISPALEAVLMYGLAVRQKDRCKSMSELYRLLQTAESFPSQVPAEIIQPSAVVSNDSQVTQIADDADEVTRLADEELPDSHLPAGGTGKQAVPAAAANKKTSTRISGILIAAVGVLVVVAAVLLILKPFSGGKSTSAIGTESVEATEEDGFFINPGCEFTVAEDSDIAKKFQNTVDFVFGIIPVTDYNFRFYVQEDYPIAENGCYLTNINHDLFMTHLRQKGSLENPFSETFTLEGKEYTIGKVTLKDFFDNGWEYADTNNIPEANQTKYQNTSLKKGEKLICIYFKETGSDVESSTIRAVLLYGPVCDHHGSSEKLSFSVGGIQVDDDIHTVYEIAVPTSVNISVGQSMNKAEFVYGIDKSGLYTRVTFKYDPFKNECLQDSIYIQMEQ